jgi:tripartite-type tricarboxylate transporter receptor subunit TctC
MKRNGTLGIVLAFVLAFSMSAAQAQGAKYPAKEIAYIIAFNPGGESDIEFRAMQSYFEKALGVRFVPDYKPAAGGALAWQTLAGAAPDGYTLAGFNSPHIITQPLTMKDVKFQTEDFTYLSIIENTPSTLVVRKGFPAATLKEFVDYAKKNPGKVTIAAVGKFSGPHLNVLQFMKVAGIKLTYIPLQGTGQVKPQLMGGHVDAAFTNSPAAVEMNGTGVSVLAVGTEERMKQLPGVPTFAESGYKIYPRIDRGIVAPKNLPPEVAQKLDKAFYAIVTNKDVQAKLSEAGFVPNPMNMAQATQYMKEQKEVVAKLLDEEKLMQTK